jgi:hypothetical protein
MRVSGRSTPADIFRTATVRHGDPGIAVDGGTLAVIKAAIDGGRLLLEVGRAWDQAEIRLKVVELVAALADAKSAIAGLPPAQLPMLDHRADDQQWLRVRANLRVVVVQRDQLEHFAP